MEKKTFRKKSLMEKKTYFLLEKEPALRKQKKKIN